METILAFVIGGLFGAGIFMMLRRSILKFIIGLSLIAHAANLLVFTVAGLTRGEPPLIPQSMTELADDANFGDPLPSALILTAIVISFFGRGVCDGACPPRLPDRWQRRPRRYAVNG